MREAKSVRHFPPIGERIAALRAAHESITDAQAAAAIRVGLDYELAHGEAWAVLEADGWVTVGGCKSALPGAPPFCQDTAAISYVAPDGTTSNVAPEGEGEP